MSSAITFYFKDIFKTQDDFIKFLQDEKIIDDDAEKITFGQYVYKLLFRRYHNSNIQYDTTEDFKNDLANILEDSFDKFKTQNELIKKLHKITDEDIFIISEALANQANNPNSSTQDPKQPLNYISAQAYSYAKDNKLQAYLRALNNMPTKLINELLINCSGLFKRYIPQQTFTFKGDR